MNGNKSPTPGELTIVVAGGVMFVASFLDFEAGTSAWGKYVFPVATLLPIYGVIMAVEIVERTSFGADFDRVAYTHDVVDALARHDVALIAMAGFGTILEKPIHDAYPDRIVNTHPALLPAFKGWHAVRDALDAGVKVTGCTVHLARLEVDEGPILAQEAVPVLDDDTLETLHERIKEVERRIYPEVLRSLAEQPDERRDENEETVA